MRHEAKLPSRRAILGAGVLAAAALVAPAARPTLAAATPAGTGPVPPAADVFMRASKLLIQHRLSPGVGTRLAVLLGSRVPSLDADLLRIIETARTKQATQVENFFDALPVSVQETAHRIIFGWYAGVVDDSPDAEVFAYEEALMYQPTKDAVALPTYGFDGPDRWVDVDPPLSAMPDF